MLLFNVETSAADRAAGRVARSSGYVAALAAVLGNGAEWEYRGEVDDLADCSGRCACGHTGLRYLFTLHHCRDARTVQVGSSCVETYPGITPELAERMRGDLDRLRREAAEVERRAREAAQAAEVQSLLVRWSDLEWAQDEAAAAWWRRHGFGAFAPVLVYRRSAACDRLAARAPGALHPLVRVPALKTSRGQAERLRAEVRAAERRLGEIKAGM